MQTQLPIGLEVKNTNGYTYRVLAQSNEDTLLQRDTGYTKYTVAWHLYAEEPNLSGEVYVTWDQGHYFTNGDEAMKFMQDRHMERTGENLCHYEDCPACQFFDDCEEK